MQAVVVHVHSLGYWPLLLLPAVRVGFAGALSTVSTFVAEVSQPCTATVLHPSYAQCQVLSQPVAMLRISPCPASHFLHHHGVRKFSLVCAACS